MSVLFSRSVYLIALLYSFLLVGCTSVPALESNAIAPKVELPDNLDELGVISKYEDPWGSFNRRMYYFNAKADEYVILPVVAGYKKVTPDVVELGIHNFFNNLGEISTFVNSLLQLKLSVAGETLGRFALNSTLGLAGLFDVATPIGLVEQNEDFGQTLGYWGVRAGPYVVLPLLGPSSLRDATGLVYDSLASQQVIDELKMTTDQQLFMSLIEAIDTRSSLPFRYYSSGSAFEYEHLKLLYKKYREIQVAR